MPRIHAGTVYGHWVHRDRETAACVDAAIDNGRGGNVRGIGHDAARAEGQFAGSIRADAREEGVHGWIDVCRGCACARSAGARVVKHEACDGVRAREAHHRRAIEGNDVGRIDGAGCRFARNRDSLAEAGTV